MKQHRRKRRTAPRPRRSRASRAKQVPMSRVNRGKLGGRARALALSKSRRVAIARMGGIAARKARVAKARRAA